MEAENDLKILKFTNKEFANTLKNAMAMGLPVLIEDLEEYIDPSIDPVLGKQYYEHEGRTLIKFGDKEAEYNTDFRLYMTTKLPNPHYLPEIFIKTTIINFTVTFEGLED